MNTIPVIDNELFWEEVELLKNISNTTAKFSLAQHVLNRTERLLGTRNH